MWSRFLYQEDSGRMFVWHQGVKPPKVGLGVEDLTWYKFVYKTWVFKDTRSTRQDTSRHVIVFYDVKLCILFEFRQTFGFRQPAYGDRFTKLHGIIFQKTTIVTAARTSNHGGCCIHVPRTASSEVRMVDTDIGLVQPLSKGSMRRPQLLCVVKSDADCFIAWTWRMIWVISRGFSYKQTAYLPLIFLQNIHLILALVL
jgi:hypothetical protein